MNFKISQKLWISPNFRAESNEFSYYDVDYPSEGGEGGDAAWVQT